MKNKQKAKFSFGAYLSFFTRFPIPWWLFLLSLLLEFLLRTTWLRRIP